MYQQEWNADCGDVMAAASLEYIPEPHDGRITGSDISWLHVVVHTKMKGDMDFWEVRMACDVELSCKEHIQV